MWNGCNFHLLCFVVSRGIDACNEYERHTWLVNVHERLDAAVADAYGWDADLSDEQVLERLLALNLERYEAEEGEAG